jgi:glycosyltransferase involved in cell wall biosynthesis
LDRQLLSGRRWTYLPTADLRGISLAGKCRRNWYRLRARVGRTAVRWGRHDPQALGYAVSRLRDAARNYKADLTILHLQAALWVGLQLLQDGRRIGVDVEDWYSEDGPADTAYRGQLAYYRSLEKSILVAARHVTTTSYALAHALTASYQCRKPEVIYNSVRAVSIVPQCRNNGRVGLFWFSQNLGPGRGLEPILAALPRLTGEWELELRGNASTEVVNWVTAQIPAALRQQVRIEPIVPPEQLNRVVARHDIGLAADQTYSRSRDLTVANKLLQYLQSGLVVLASETAGHREILQQLPGSGVFYPQGDVVAIATTLNAWIKRPQEVARLRHRTYAEANAKFAYERQIPRLLTGVERALC